MKTSLLRSLLLVTVSGLAASAAALDNGTVRVRTDNGWKAFEVISQGDNPSGDGHGYAMPGVFDGAGAYLVDGSTLRVLVNHETSDAAVSEVDLDLGNLHAAIRRTIDSGGTGGFRFVVAARQAYDRVSYDGGRSWTATSSASNTDFVRFCSAQAYAPDTFGPDRGFVDHVYITGEETDGGALFAIDSVERDFYQLSGVTGSAPGGTGGMPFDAFENAALIDTGETDHVALLLSPDGGTQRLMLYVGDKGRLTNGNAGNSFLARNGLAYGRWYYLNGSLPGGVGTTLGGSFDTTSSGALQASKMEDVDTSPGQPTRVVLGNQNYGVFTFDFDLVFSPGFNPAQSSFALTKVDENGGGLSSADNVDWTSSTTLGGTTHPEGLLFVNEDNSSGEIWMMRPDGSRQTRVGQTIDGSESTGIVDISEFVGYAPGSVLLSNSQGSTASMTVLIHPDATADGGACSGATCPDSCESTLASEDQLNPGERICSPNGLYHFTLDTSGDLVLYAGGQVLWSAGISSGDSQFARMQGDGNLVVRNSAGSAIWSTGTHGNRGAILTVQDDGRAVIRLGGSVLWSVGASAPVAQRLVLASTADAYVDQSRAATNFGGAQALLVDTSPERYETLLRFRVPALTAPVRRATLRMFVANGSDDGPKVYQTSNGWSEAGVTWNNRPGPLGARIADVGNTPEGWLEIDVTSAITAGRDYSFLLQPDAINGVDFDSREASRKPELVVDTGEESGATQEIRQVGTTQVWDSNGENVRIARPSGSQTGDLLILVLHRTDDELPLYVDGWTRVAECYKRDNEYNCSTEADCTSWHNDAYCASFGSYGREGRDLAQSVFYRVVRSGEPGAYEFDMNRDGSGHPGWIILTALRGAATSDPVRDWSHTGCDNNPDSVFPSVYGQAGDLVLLSQFYDDAIAQSNFGAPLGTRSFGYVSNSDEAGFLFGGTLTSNGETGTMKTQGSGGSNCKDALVSLTIRPQ